ncbi:uncharacterized protein LOC124642045 [Helicoverpa zea]|uniref:uncharacterized protein LOC124642045 n=1 Tax=Helicoverpa zea TaxID=7113 RepID=UPI001F5A4D70|nr:uncharacterized protein LOC124642045 [Helicoverpa zea]
MGIVKMSRILSLICVITLLLDTVTGEEVTKATIGVEAQKMGNQDLDLEDLINPDIETAITKLEKLAETLDQLNIDDSKLIADPEEISEEMTKLVHYINEAVKLNPNNAYKFLKAKGLDRIVSQDLKVDDDKLKVHVLILLKLLFEVAPTTTSAVIPITVVDRLLDIFEIDNLALKAHSLDVLYLWLPDNPKVQARVMKLKGLVPFYEQAAKLDTSGIKTLLDLFNKILKEHLIVREDPQKTIVEPEKMKFYVRTGLLEHMATPAVCNGLLNIFIKTWTYSTDENNIIATVFDMLKVMKKFCLKMYRGKVKAKKLFAALQEYVKEPENIDYFEANGLNVTDVSLVVEEYVDKIRSSVKDEM